MEQSIQEWNKQNFLKAVSHQLYLGSILEYFGWNTSIFSRTYFYFRSISNNNVLKISKYSQENTRQN